MVRPYRRTGFTLIELLVVIAIIAILAAILFPVFSRARRSALANSCLSNEKQMALAFQQYIIDYDHCAPFITNDTYYGVRPGTPSTFFVKLYPYVKNTQIYKCPLSGDLTAPATYTAAELAAGYLDIPLVGYKTNGNIFMRYEAGYVQKVLNMENVPDPSTVCMLCESKYNTGAASFGTGLNANVAVGEPPYVYSLAPGIPALGCYYGWTPSTYDWGDAWPHNNGENLAFCDGHVEFRGRGDIYPHDFGLSDAFETGDVHRSLF